MTWVRLEDDMPTHPKVEPLPDGGFRMFVHLIAYSNRYNLDGFISRAQIDLACKAVRARPRHIWNLIGARLLHELDTTGARVEHDPSTIRAQPRHTPDTIFEVHDIGEYQPTTGNSAELSRKRSDAGKKGAAARWGDDGNLPLAKNAPVPSRPVPSPYLDQELEKSHDNGGGIQTLEHLQARFCSRCGIGIPDRGLPKLRDLLPLTPAECTSVDGSKVRSWKGLFNWVSALRNPQAWKEDPKRGSEHEAAQQREQRQRASEKAAQRARKAPIEPGRPELRGIEKALGGKKISEIVGNIEPTQQEEGET